MASAAPAKARLLLFAAIAVLAVTAVFSLKGAFQDSHWDAPIYLMRGKHVAETPLLAGFSAHAHEIADATRRGGEARAEGRWFFWPFMRLGNAALLGAVSMVFGTTTAGVNAAFLLYTFFMAGAAVMGGLLSVRLIEVFRGPIPAGAVWTGAGISALLYVGSDVYRHLSGNLVAEIPALFFLTGSALTLVLATRSRSIAWAILSGALAFLVYFVKLEAIWVAVTFGLLLVIVLWRYGREAFWLPAFVTTAATALVLYLAYAWWMYPLADPRLVKEFAQALPRGRVNPIPNYKIVAAAGGLLWLGLIPAVRYCWKHPALWLALAWLCLFLVPYAGNLAKNGPAQARMFALIALPLLLASTLGWSAIVHRFQTGRRWLPALSMLVATGALLAISHEESYRLARSLPGSWRLQHIREWVSPTRYERIDYPLEDIAAVSQFVHSQPGPRMVLWNWEDGPVAEYIDLIRYLGPPLPPGVDVIVEDLFPSQQRDCDGHDRRLRFESVFFCTALPSGPAERAASATVPLLQLHRVGSNGGMDASPRGRVVFRTDTLVVYDWGANANTPPTR